VPVIAVTGTNGKSTTTTLLVTLLHAAGLRAGLAGNVGTPALDLVGQPLDVAVLEVSSFQLETTESFRPKVAVVLNLTPDHLDRHHTFDAYVAAKLRILANQGPDDWAVLNADDPACGRFEAAARGGVLRFRSTGPIERGIGLDAGSLLIRDGDGPAQRYRLDAWQQPGAHNRENAVAALAAIHAFGIDLAGVLPALADFTGLPHRTQIVAERDGVTWVDDSKATNPGAAVRALGSFSQPIVWIAGGRAKGLDLAPLAEAARPHLRAAVLIGEAADRIAEAFAGDTPVHREPDIETAVRRAATLARSGDVVLLAPGCASHDQFASFEERGDRFQAAVRDLGADAGGTP